MHRVIRVMRDRMAMLMVEEAGMSTVEYSTRLDSYHERMPLCVPLFASDCPA